MPPARYLLGRAWPGRGWLQWNDRFRDDVRGFLRGEEGLVPALVQRVQGSPDLFDAPMDSVNFLACHDGFTLYDLVAYDHKHNEANGWGGRDGTDHNRSWNCGWEGDDGVPADVARLRRRQLRNAWCLLAMSHGVPMFGDGRRVRPHAGRQQQRLQPGQRDVVGRLGAGRGLRRPRALRRLLLALRHRHPVLSQPEWWGEDVSFFGVDGPADLGPHSRSLGWQVGDLT